MSELVSVAGIILSVLLGAEPDSPRRSGPIVVNREHPPWFQYKGGAPFYLCGPGDPEGFLYRGKRNPDGTRDGDQMALIRKLAGTGANCIYFQAIRSHGGDGERTHNPFIDSDPDRGISTAILDQWETWFTEMDRNGIVIFFFLYDDGVKLFGKELPAGGELKPDEAAFIDALVSRFRHHRHLIWCVAEEFEEGLTKAHAVKIAGQIRRQDDQHPIGIHQLNGTRFAFGGKSPFDQFTAQWNRDSPGELHDGAVAAWRHVGGRININLSEFTDSSFDRPFAGTGAALRQKLWAIALGGAYSMVLGMDIASTPVSDLEDCGRLVRFMEATRFHQTSPHDELARANTKYVLADPGRVYIAYADGGGPFGLSIVPGSYRVKWYDPRTGAWTDEGRQPVGQQEATFRRPSSLQGEAALYLESVNEQ